MPVTIYVPNQRVISMLSACINSASRGECDDRQLYIIHDSTCGRVWWGS